MKIAVDSLLPNPFRHLNRYPIRREKVDALKASIESTDFWDNLLARPNGKGFEIAYGHHRLEALKELGIKEVDIPVRELDDATMLRIMANENMDEWGASALVLQETVRAVVDAYAKGRIKLSPAPKTAGHMRYAPSFLVMGTGEDRSRNRDHPYTAKTVAKFLGWGESRVKVLLQSLEAAERGSHIDYAGLGTAAANLIVSEHNYVEKQTGDIKLAAKIANQLADEFREGSITTNARGYRAINHIREHTDDLITEVTIDELATESMEEVKKIKAKHAKAQLEKYDRQVKEFLDWTKSSIGPIKMARRSVIKFSPEAKRFTVRRINTVLKELTELREVLSK